MLQGHNLQSQGEGQRQAKVQGLVVECDHYHTIEFRLHTVQYTENAYITMTI